LGARIQIFGVLRAYYAAKDLGTSRGSQINLELILIYVMFHYPLLFISYVLGS